MVIRFFEHLDAIDELAQEPPSDKVVIQLKHHFAEAQASRHYFFSKVATNPAWWPLLEKHGIIQFPAEDIQNEDSGHHWPPIHYLEKLVQEGHTEVVAEFILQLPPFRSSGLHADLNRIAVALPVEQAEKWAQREIKWVQTNPAMMVNTAETLADLAIKLAPNHFETARLLIKEVLYIGPDAQWDYQKGKGGDPAEYIAFPSPSLRCDPYTYRSILRDRVPILSQERPLDILELLCDLLEMSITYSSRDGGSSKPNDLLSAIRPAIEDHEQNSDFRIEAPLIDAVRNTLLQILKKDRRSLPDIIKMLERREWDIFQRFILFLLSQCTAPDDPDRRKHLMEKRFLENPSFRYEYIQLLRTSFPQLQSDDQQNLLNLINTVAETKNKELQKRGENKEIASRWARNWQYLILLPLEEHLTGEWANTLEHLRNEFGEPPIPPGLTSYTNIFWGSRSPIPLEEFSQLGVFEIIDYLRSFTPASASGEPSTRGLGRVLAEDVKNQPEKYTSAVPLFTDGTVPLHYLADIIWGWSDSLQADKDVDYSAVFTLISWLYEKLDNGSNNAPTVQHRSHIRSNIVRFLQLAFEREKGFPLDLHKQAWDLLWPLTNDQSPDQEEEERTSDPVFLSINSVRGNALHAVINYAWMHALRAHKENRKTTRSDIPEVFDLIEEHLHGEFSLSTTDRSVWGQWLNRLIWIDREWVRDHINDIFPTAAEKQKQFDAAWASYLSRAEFRPDTFTLLYDVYRHAILHFPETPESETAANLTSKRLTEHITIAYMQDLIFLGKDDLVGLFFQNAPVRFAAHAFFFIGNHLPDEQPFRERAIKLWNWRLQHGMTATEASQFTIWFERLNLEPAWSLPQLEKAIRATEGPQIWGDPFPRLLGLFDKYPAECLGCVYAAAHNGDYLVAPTEGDELWQLLEKGIRHENPEIRNKTEDIVHYLGSLGHFRYRKLLKPDHIQ